MNIQMTDYLRINISDMILVLISTCLIIFIAKRYFWTSILGYFDRREKLIADELAQAKQAQLDGEAYREQYAEQLKGARSEAFEIIESAKVSAEQEGAELLSKAKDDAKLIYEKAQRDIERERVQAENEIKKEITEVAFMAASKIVRKELDEQKQKDYIDEFIENVGDR